MFQSFFNQFPQRLTSELERIHSELSANTNSRTNSRANSRVTSHTNISRGNFSSIFSNSGTYRALPTATAAAGRVDREAKESDLRLPPWRSVQLHWIDNQLHSFRDHSSNKMKKRDSVSSDTINMVNRANRSDTEAVIDLRGEAFDISHYLASVSPRIGDGPLLNTRERPLSSSSIQQTSNGQFEIKTVQFMLQTDRVRNLKVILYIRPEGISNREWTQHLRQPNTLRRLRKIVEPLINEKVNTKVIHAAPHNQGALLTHYQRLYHQLVTPGQPMTGEMLLERIDNYTRHILITEGVKQMPSIKSYAALIKTLTGDLMNEGLLTKPYDPPTNALMKHLRSDYSSTYEKIESVSSASNSPSPSQSERIV